MSGRSIALVTGGNRGIGKEICRQLIEKDWTVILTSRSKDKGQTAIEELSSGKGTIHLQQLDVTVDSSIRHAAKFVESEFGHLDVLINNAGVFLDRGAPPNDLDIEKFSKTLNVNTTGVLRTIQTFLPLLRNSRHGRIVNMSSGMGQMGGMTGNALAYRTSKAALNALTLCFADSLKSDGILVNAMSPGWVQTDMGGENANRSVDEGADTAVWLAELPEDGPTGKFFRDRKEISW